MDPKRTKKIALLLIVIGIIVGGYIIIEKRKERRSGEALGDFLLLGAIQAEELCLTQKIGAEAYEVLRANPSQINDATLEILADCI